MRTTTHNARKSSKNGVFSAKHNDRNFDYKNDKHIDSNLSQNNFYWHIFNKEKLTFEEAELKYYEKEFGEYLNKKNEKRNLQGNNDRIQTMQQYLRNERTCPEESLYCIGNKDNHADARKLKNICIKYQNWMKHAFPQVRMLDFALHIDEAGAPHVHERHVFLAFDDNDLLYSNQKKALEQMNIPLPDPKQPVSRYNNRKMTFTKICREKFNEICKEYKIEVEVEPDKINIKGLELDEFKNLKELKKENKKLKKYTKELEKENQKLKEENIQLLKNKREISRENAILKATNQAKKTFKQKNTLDTLDKNINKFKNDKNR